MPGAAPGQGIAAPAIAGASPAMVIAAPVIAGVTAGLVIGAPGMTGAASAWLAAPPGVRDAMPLGRGVFQTQSLIHAFIALQDNRRAGPTPNDP